MLLRTARSPLVPLPEAKVGRAVLVALRSGACKHAKDRSTRLQARALPMLSQCPYAHHATVLTRLSLREQGERNQENAAGHPAGAAAEEIETGQEDRQP